MTRPTALHPQPPTTVRDWRPRYVHLWWMLAGAVVLAVAILLGPLLRMPSHVDALMVENPTSYDITVASSGDGVSWTPVGTVRAGETATFDRVADQGDTWVFRFSSQGRDGGQVERTRDQLEQADWQVPVPTSVGDTLAADGAPEPR